MAFEFSGVSLPIVSHINAPDKSPNLPFSAIFLTTTFEAKRHLQHIEGFFPVVTPGNGDLINQSESRKYMI